MGRARRVPFARGLLALRGGGWLPLAYLGYANRHRIASFLRNLRARRGVPSQTQAT